MAQQLLQRADVITRLQQMRGPRKSLPRGAKRFKAFYVASLTRLRATDASPNNDAIDSSEIFFRCRSSSIAHDQAHLAARNKPHSRSTAMAHDMTLRKPLPPGALSIAFANLSRSRYTIRNRHLNGEHKRRTCHNPNSETALREVLYAATPIPVPHPDTSPAKPPATTPFRVPPPHPPAMSAARFANAFGVPPCRRDELKAPGGWRTAMKMKHLIALMLVVIGTNLFTCAIKYDILL
jgi:hypothetical protein